MPVHTFGPDLIRVSGGTVRIILIVINLMIIYQKHTVIDSVSSPSVEPAVSLMIGQKSCDFVFHDFSLRIFSHRHEPIVSPTHLITRCEVLKL